MKKEIAVFTTIFPSALSYLETFMNSLRNQTNKDFDLFIANDSVVDLEEMLKEYQDFNIIIYDVKFSISKNREAAIKKITELGYKIVIFADIDDFCEKNRVEVSLRKMKQYDVVVNDVSLFFDTNIYDDYYFSKRLSNDTEIDADFITDKNIFGLSNTAVKVELLKDIVLNEKLEAVDWYLFAVLLEKGAKSIFTNETRTFYRQYENNLSNIDKYDKKSVMNCLRVKIMHYGEMKLISERYNYLHNKACTLEEGIVHGKIKFNIYKPINENLFWWEITNYIKTL